MRLVAERALHTTLRLRTIAVPTEATFSDQGVDVVLISEGTSRRTRASGCTTTAAWWWPRRTRRRRRARSTFSPPSRMSSWTPNDGSSPMRCWRTGASPTGSASSVPTICWCRSWSHAEGVALLRHRVAATMRTLADLRIEEFPFPLPGLGIDMVWNPRLSDQYFLEWLRALLFDAAKPV
ncbi:hypothetical protein SHKM778_51100 [Streptomyces sp. KM77-8]|uniref:LysR substrate-binding domain-containing protein n=1 Tax=Streptomyces haneummycinicus TaxID=3074435 RepID=A0AAT9HMN4_9ACTN